MGQPAPRSQGTGVGQDADTLLRSVRALWTERALLPFRCSLLLSFGEFNYLEWDRTIRLAADLELNLYGAQNFPRLRGHRVGMARKHSFRLHLIERYPQCLF